jgi:cation diffusion facilitator family transporter
MSAAPAGGDQRRGRMSFRNVPAMTPQGRPVGGGRTRAAAVSIISNSLLIILKVVAGTITGSVAILAEAMHSSVDLIASIVAFFSVRKAEEPADEDHRYGHEKVENLGAWIEGMLILVGSAVIAIEAIRRLAQDAPVDTLGLGIAVIAVSIVVNLVVAAFLRARAAATESAALAADAAHLATDAFTSGGVLIALVLVQITGERWIDGVVALLVAAFIVSAGIGILSRASRVLVDEALPAEELEAIRESILAFGPKGVAGYHKLRTRRAGAQRYVDLHVQFREGTTLEAAHRTAHELQDAIGARLRHADVLIHLEPEDSVRPGTEVPPAPEGPSGTPG